MVVDRNSLVITVAVQAPCGQSIYIVPREAFLMRSESRRLHEVFNKPQLIINDAQGRCIGTHPHVLPGITEVEFDALLAVLLYGP
ncbi:hypothetical protein FA13DRAFT_1815084 [Coprinellus micaceus]|uniref:Uncharacterized protein n=1 Tax=Coprinellus micaceus TaxID=71717 RepID=A0A4Y7T7S1_COPMI|nr:hypothetical protein FA13DRAFT_1815084 [Coprinellus micaceus]